MADQVLETVEWLLDGLSHESIDLCCVAVAACTKSAGILKGVVSSVYKRAVVKPTMCHLYAQLCSKLDLRLAAFPPDNGKEISFKQHLIDKCQKFFESDGELCAEIEQMTALDLQPNDKQRIVKLGNVRLISELWKQKIVPDESLDSVIQKLLGMDGEGCPTLQNVEAISQLLQTIGKEFDRRPTLRGRMDVYFKRLKEVAMDSVSALHVVFSLVLLRSSNWEPFPSLGVEAEIQLELEENSNDTFYNQLEEDFDDKLERMAITDHLLEQDLKESRNVGNPSNHDRLIRMLISTGLKTSPPRIKRVSELLEQRLAEKSITVKDVADGCVSYGRMMNFLGTYNPRAPHEFGEIMGKLVLVAGLDFGVVKEVLEAITRCDSIRKMVFNATISVVGSSPSSKNDVLAAQATEIEACRLCCGLL